MEHLSFPLWIKEKQLMAKHPAEWSDLKLNWFFCALFCLHHHYCDKWTHKANTNCKSTEISSRGKIHYLKKIAVPNVRERNFFAYPATTLKLVPVTLIPVYSGFTQAGIITGHGFISVWCKYCLFGCHPSEQPSWKSECMCEEETARHRDCAPVLYCTLMLSGFRVCVHSHF